MKQQQLIQLKMLIKSGSTFFLYGQKSSGKTTLIKQLLQDSKTKYVEFNCTLADKRINFLKLLNVELSKHLRKFDPEFYSFSSPTNLEAWTNELRNLGARSEEAFEGLNGLCIFMDNVEELKISSDFLQTFYTTCKNEFKFKLSFIFCGINHGESEYTLEQPFRTMICFAMPRPIELYDSVIKETVEKIVFGKYPSTHSTEKELQKVIKTLSGHIRVSFESTQFSLEKIRHISKVITTTLMDGIQDTINVYKELMKKINGGEAAKQIREVVEHGPLYGFERIKKLDILQSKIQNLDTNLEYYPNLIMTSIHLADYYNETEDKRRFQDYKSKTTSRKKDLVRNQHKTTKHNPQRIIAIAEALESQAKENQKEIILPHHSLDFYASFEYLKAERRIKISQKGNIFSGSKIQGVAKEEDARGFMKKYDLDYSQFM